MAKNNTTKNKILSAAFSTFMEKGYEETSIRMILDKSNISIGSFYHFFTSKEQVFEAVIECYLEQYTKQVDLIFKNTQLSIIQRIDAFILELKNRINGYYKSLEADKLHWTIQCSLHEKTIEALIPSIEYILNESLGKGLIKSKLNTDTKTQSIILIKGVEGILHSYRMSKIDDNKFQEIQQLIKQFINLIFEQN